jgi:hypothetical protein
MYSAELPKNIKIFLFPEHLVLNWRPHLFRPLYVLLGKNWFEMETANQLRDVIEEEVVKLFKEQCGQKATESQVCASQPSLARFRILGFWVFGVKGIFIRAVRQQAR